MKPLFSAALILIGLLTLAAFNPGRIVDVIQDTRFRLIEEPRMVRDLAALADAARQGDPVALYDVGQLHASSKWHLEDWQGKALGGKDPQLGDQMIRHAARLGHPEARYWVWQRDEGTDTEFVRILEAGSNMALNRVYSGLHAEPCGNEWTDYVEVVREHLDDPTYPWVHPRTPESPVAIRSKWKQTFVQRTEELYKIRSRICHVEALGS